MNSDLLFDFSVNGKTKSFTWYVNLTEIMNLYGKRKY